MKFSRILIVVIGMAIACSAAAVERIEPRAWVGLRFHLEPAVEGRTAAFLFVDSVVPGGPADHAGLRRQDILVAIDGKPIAFATNLEALKFFGSIRVGQKVRARVVHNESSREAVITAIALPESARKAWDANLSRATAPRPKP
jgi:S1-C subfamily serine protease